MPYVVAHVAVSLDGATTGFPVDVDRYYELVSTWHEDITLTGADTVLAQADALAQASGPGPKPGGPLLAVVDSRRRVGQWQALRNTGYWSDVVALRCSANLGESGNVTELFVGTDRVDLATALRALGERPGVGVVRVDSGGSLIGALLNDGLLDELSLLVHPNVAGAAGATRWYGPRLDRALSLDPVSEQRLGDLIWLRYTSAAR